MCVSDVRPSAFQAKPKGVFLKQLMRWEKAVMKRGSGEHAGKRKAVQGPAGGAIDIDTRTRQPCVCFRIVCHNCTLSTSGPPGPPGKDEDTGTSSESSEKKRRVVVAGPPMPPHLQAPAEQKVDVEEGEPIAAAEAAAQEAPTKPAAAKVYGLAMPPGR